MKRTSLSVAGISTVLIAASVTAATAADMVTKAPPPTAVAAPAARTSFWDFLVTSCPLSWYGITIYGTVDAGATWQSHGTPYNGSLPAGAEYLIQKNSNRALWNPANNAVNQSNIGIKGKEEFAPGWAFVFDLQANFNPYSLQLSNGPPPNSAIRVTPLMRAGQTFQQATQVQTLRLCPNQDWPRHRPDKLANTQQNPAFAQLN